MEYGHLYCFSSDYHSPTYVKFGVELQKLRSFKGVSRNVQENCKKNNVDGIDVFQDSYPFFGELCKKTKPNSERNNGFGLPWIPGRV